MEVLLEFPDAASVTQIGNAILEKAGLAMDVTTITEEQMNQSFTNLGQAFLLSRITSTGSGSDLRTSLDINKTVQIKQLASWCILEFRCDKYLEFMERIFEGYKVREIQGAKIRTEVPFHMADGTLRKLATMFHHIETNTKELFIREYSIAQTSLEQIFNHFASQQVEESGNIIPTGNRT
jgi:ATP-binding cassette subfamily A (ABC1) protein 1